MAVTYTHQTGSLSYQETWGQVGTLLVPPNDCARCPRHSMCEGIVGITETPSVFRGLGLFVKLNFLNASVGEEGENGFKIPRMELNDHNIK